MNFKKINPFFLKFIENQKKKSPKEKKEFRTIISFENVSKRENFILNNKNVKILNKFDLIPAISAYLKTEQILKFDKEDSIKQIEEDQRLFLSLLEVNEILEVDKYKKSQIPYTGKKVNVGIIDNGINSNFLAISNVSKYQFKNKHRINIEITHGTLMASIIANQFKDSENNYIGIAPDVKITDFNISNPAKEYYFSHILEVFDSINKENSNIDVLLISLTTADPSDGKDILSLACDLLVEHGTIIVSPAGNFGPDPSTIGSPSAAKKVISFGAVTKGLLIEEYSGKGPTIDDRLKPDFSLPGSNVKTPLSIVEIFKNMDLLHEKILPYNILVKKAIKISVEFTILFMVLYFLFLIF
ncbi:MAG: S8 family serine peptidase [Promethearchaeota archaeon]|jgi:serine protease AprX